MTNKELTESMLSLTQEMLPVVQELLTTRSLCCPKEIKDAMVDRVYKAMIDPKVDFFSQWPEESKQELKKILTDNFAKLSVYNAHKLVFEFVKDRYQVYCNAIDKATIEYSSKQSIKKKTSEKLGKLLDEYVTPVMKDFESFQNDQDGSQDPLLKATNHAVNLLTTAKTFIDAVEMKENNKLEGVVGELSLVLSACLVLDAMSNFIGAEANKYEIVKQTKKYNFALSKTINNYEYNGNYYKKLQEKKVLSIEKVFLAFAKIRNLLFGDFYKEVQEVLKSDILPPSLMNSTAISKIISYYENRRVDTMKEAINLYFMETQQDEKIQQIQKEYEEKINKINSEVNEYKLNVENRINSMNAQQEELVRKHNKMVEENKKLQKKHDELVEDHNELVEEHNKMVDELNSR